MSATCAAPHCPTYGEDGCFRLFKFPAEEKLFEEWAKNACINFRNSHCVGELHLCEIHFESAHFVGGNRKNDLKPSSVPTIFLHTTPTKYIMNVCSLLGESGHGNSFTAKALEMLNQNQLSPDCTSKNVLISIGYSLVVAELQSKRLLKKKFLLNEILDQNQALRCLHKEYTNLIRNNQSP